VRGLGGGRQLVDRRGATAGEQQDDHGR
jgi:hypothetical protein